MSIKIYITFPVDSNSILLKTIRELPIETAPVYISTSERVQDKSNRLNDEKRFTDLLIRSKKFGFTLIGKNISYHLSPTTFRDSGNIATHGYLYIEIKKGFKHKNELEALFIKLLNINGVDFGYMCEFDESIHRNRLKKVWSEKQSGASSIEFSIGTNFTKYVPGLYWKTAFSQDYLTSNKIDIEELRPLALNIDVINTDTETKKYVLTFFDKSKNWIKHKERIDDYLASNNSFFSLCRVNKRIKSSTTEKQLMLAVSDYI